MGLSLDLGAGPIGVDSALFIYYIEDHPEYIRLVAPLFEAVEAGGLAVVTSALTLLEILVVPLRSGDAALASRYEEILSHSRGVGLVEVDRGQLRAAAQLRATYPGLRTPDAIQLAAALSSRCSAFVTNDRDLPRIPGVRLVQLRDYIKG